MRYQGKSYVNGWSAVSNCTIWVSYILSTLVGELSVIEISRLFHTISKPPLCRTSNSSASLVLVHANLCAHWILSQSLKMQSLLLVALLLLSFWTGLSLNETDESYHDCWKAKILLLNHHPCDKTRIQLAIASYIRCQENIHRRRLWSTTILSRFTSVALGCGNGHCSTDDNVCMNVKLGAFIFS